VAHGRVQGVFFRASAEQEARDAGLDGWVRNCPDGTVEAVFEGSVDAVDRLVRWCRRGPRGAQVTRLDVHEEPPEGVHGFHIRSEPAPERPPGARIPEGNAGPESR
jgi:acylphosphatase